MRSSEIISMIRSNLSLGLFVFLGFILLFSFGYFIVYKKFLKGSKKIKLKSIFFPSLLLIYMFMVVAATLLDRGAIGVRQVNLHIFSSYREAWNQWSLRGWQYQILNILMFMPFGFLLPIVSNKFRSFKKIFMASLGFTLFIETIQLLTARGVFELDDIFNNLLGGILGYSIIKGLYYLFKKKDIKRGVLFFIPISTIILGFFIMFNAYDSKELGNLYIDPNYRYNMKNIELTSSLEFRRDKEVDKVYKVSSYTKEEALEFAKNLLSGLGVSEKDIEVIDYQKDSIYKGGDYILWIDKSDRRFNIRDFSVEGDSKTALDEDEAYRKLKEYAIDFPEDMDYKIEDDLSIFIADGIRKENKLFRGEISLESSNGEIVRIENNIVSYEEYSEEDLKTEYEAWEDIVNGNFNYYRDDVKKIELLEILDDYMLDSKGYYQPVYNVRAKIDKEDSNIYIRRVRDR